MKKEITAVTMIIKIDEKIKLITQPSVLFAGFGRLVVKRQLFFLAYLRNGVPDDGVVVGRSRGGFFLQEVLGTLGACVDHLRGFFSVKFLVQDVDVEPLRHQNLPDVEFQVVLAGCGGTGAMVGLHGLNKSMGVSVGRGRGRGMLGHLALCCG